MIQRRLCGGQVRQARGDRVLGVGSPQAEQPGQLLAGAPDLPFAELEVDAGLLGLATLRLEVQIAQIARLVLGGRERRGGVGALRDDPAQRRRLLRALQREVRRPHASRMVQHLIAHAQLGRLETGARGRLLRRDRQQIEKVFGHSDDDGRTDRTDLRGRDADGQHRVAQQARLDEIGLRDAEVLVGRYERAVAQEGDLHGTVDGEVSCRAGREGRKRSSS